MITVGKRSFLIVVIELFIFYIFWLIFLGKKLSRHDDVTMMLSWISDLVSYLRGWLSLFLPSIVGQDKPPQRAWSCRWSYELRHIRGAVIWKAQLYRFTLYFLAYILFLYYYTISIPFILKIWIGYEN